MYDDRLQFVAVSVVFQLDDALRRENVSRAWLLCREPCSQQEPGARVWCCAVEG